MSSSIIPEAEADCGARKLEKDSIMPVRSGFERCITVEIGSIMPTGSSLKSRAVYYNCGTSKAVREKDDNLEANLPSPRHHECVTCKKCAFRGMMGSRRTMHDSLEKR